MAGLAKLILGVLSLVPFVFFALFFGWLVPAFFAPTPEGEETLFGQRFDQLVPLAMMTSALLVVVAIVYAVMLARRPSISLPEKVGVPVAIVFTNGIILPLVFWMYVWRRRGAI